MAIQIGLNSNVLKTISDKELRRLLRSTGGRDLEKVVTELKRRKSNKKNR